MDEELTNALLDDNIDDLGVLLIFVFGTDKADRNMIVQYKNR